MTQLETRGAEERSVSIANNIHAKAVELGKHVLSMTTAAGSGHPSSALALCHIVTELMYRRMRYDPADPWNPASDRLVLSIGHAVPIVYAAYADLGGVVGGSRSDARRLSVEDLLHLRELSSVLDGHPNPAEGFPFFDAATGSLGQGLSVGAGLALAARLDGIDKKIFVLAGDGEAREGQFWEAADFIVDHRLTNVCVIVSCNEHGQAGPVSPQQSAEAIAAKAAAFGWKVVNVDGHDPDELSAGFEKAGTGPKPTAVVARTVKGWGVDLMLGKNFHGKPVPDEDLARACAELDATGVRLGATAGEAMTPQPPRRVPAAVASPPAIGLPAFRVAAKRVDKEDAVVKRKLATRVAYGIALVALGDADPRIVSLDGDVSNSTYANLFAKAHPDRFFECKIAEQNMITAAAGLAATGKIPFASSFAKFLARATDQIDMASITRANIKIVGSHSGVSLGADGPSQMSMADLAYFRSMSQADGGDGTPVCRMFNPCDAVSAYRCVELMANVKGMCYLRTHRPTANFIYADDERFELGRCKQLRTGEHLTVVSSGYILHTVLEAVEQMSAQGINCNVFDAYTFPFDVTPVLETARNSGRVILTVEDNYIGGLHGEIAEAAAEHGDVRVHGMTVQRMPKSARTADEVFSYVGVGLAQIVEKATALART